MDKGVWLKYLKSLCVSFTLLLAQGLSATPRFIYSSIHYFSSRVPHSRFPSGEDWGGKSTAENARNSATWPWKCCWKFVSSMICVGDDVAGLYSRNIPTIRIPMGSGAKNKNLAQLFRKLVAGDNGGHRTKISVDQSEWSIPESCVINCHNCVFIFKYVCLRMCVRLVSRCLWTQRQMFDWRKHLSAVKWDWCSPVNI